MEAEHAKRLVAGGFGLLDGELRRAPFGNVGGDGRDGTLVGCAAQRLGRGGELFAEQLDLARWRVEWMRIGVASPIGKRHERLVAVGPPGEPFLDQPVECRQSGAALAVALIQAANPLAFRAPLGERVFDSPAFRQVAAHFPCAATLEARAQLPGADGDAPAPGVGVHRAFLFHAEQVGQHDVGVASGIGELHVHVQDELALRRVAQHAVRAVDVAVLVGQAIAAVADDRLDAAGEVRGAVLLLYGICCTYIIRSLLQARFRSKGGFPCCIVFCRGFLREVRFFGIAGTFLRQPANALARA